MTVYDKRATLQVRIAMNKILGNKNSINTEISKLITVFSHSTIIEKAFMFQSCFPPKYFCVAKVHSPFWVTCLQMPSRVAVYQSFNTYGTDFGRLHWVPDWRQCGLYEKKRLFDPFSMPYIKCRNRKFFLKKHKYM